MSNLITLSKNVDISTLSFTPMNVLKNGGKSVFINKNNGPFIIQTPLMSSPFGLTKFAQQDGEVTKEREKWTLQLSLRDIESNVPVGNFYKLLKDLDSLILKECAENSKAYFKKQYNEDILRELVSPLIIYPKDKDSGEITDKYPPMFRLTIPMVDGNIACDCYDNNKQKVALSTIDKGAKVKAIIQCSGIWFIGSKFGLSWKVIQLHVIPPSSISGFAFLADEDDEVDAPGAGEKKFIETSDDEEDPLDKGLSKLVDEEEEVVEEPAPEDEEQHEEEEEKPVAIEKKARGKKK